MVNGLLWEPYVLLLVDNLDLLLAYTELTAHSQQRQTKHSRKKYTCLLSLLKSPSCAVPIQSLAPFCHVNVLFFAPNKKKKKWTSSRGVTIWAATRQQNNWTAVWTAEACFIKNITTARVRVGCDPLTRSWPVPPWKPRFNLWWRLTKLAISLSHFLVTLILMEMQVFVQLVAISFVGAAIIHRGGYVLSSGQCNVVSSGEILWIGRRPGGNEKICPCGLWRLLQCRTLWACFILLLLPMCLWWRSRSVCVGGEWGSCFFNSTIVWDLHLKTNYVKSAPLPVCDALLMYYLT